MAVFLVIGAIVAHAWGFGEARGETTNIGVFGGPSDEAGSMSEELLASPAIAAIVATSPLASGMGQIEELSSTLTPGADTPALQGTLGDPGQAAGIFANGAGVITYRVQKGDNLSKIATNFGISAQTIINANPQTRVGVLQIGQELSILPVSGVIYTVREEGETPESIAALFNLKSSQIREFNRSVNFAALSPGTAVVIPGGKAIFAGSPGAAALPRLSGYFVQPVEGFNWGKLHEYNAVDIANSCGTPVVASAEGLVVDTDEDGWNGGYGIFVLVEHPNGTKTRYAHLQSIKASLGDYVKQGDVIAAIGNTGNVHGPTGCHLHFEVDGAQNPFVK